MSDAVKLDPQGMARLRVALAYGLLNLGLAIEADAKRRAPVKTGNLRRSIHTAAFSEGRRIYGASDDNGRPTPNYVASKGAMAIVGTNCGYGVFLELGTRFMSAQPYLGPALNDNRGRATTLIKAGMEGHSPGVTA
jgi:HK97 gp10 family phage protein